MDEDVLMVENNAKTEKSKKEKSNSTRKKSENKQDEAEKVKFIVIGF